MAEILGKRTVESAGLPSDGGNPPVSVDEVVAFITSILGEDAAKPVVARVQEEGIDGEVMAKFRAAAFLR
eukprot:scaffold294351_cov41-Prasinocladus_malaysianus.AAC.2